MIQYVAFVSGVAMLVRPVPVASNGQLQTGNIGAAAHPAEALRTLTMVASNALMQIPASDFI
jgi:hypothetical protein